MYIESDKKEYIAYSGKVFTIEWYFDQDHQSKALKIKAEYEKRVKEGTYYEQ